jgi:hypothetical protein
VLQAMASRVATAGAPGCMGISATCEFGQSDAEVFTLIGASGKRLLSALERRLAEAKAKGEIGKDVDPRAGRAKARQPSRPACCANPAPAIHYSPARPCQESGKIAQELGIAPSMLRAWRDAGGHASENRAGRYLPTCPSSRRV